MSWLVTARTHTEISDAISQRLQDTGEAIWDDDQKNKIIRDALLEITRYAPYSVKDESLTLTGGSKELDVSAVTGVKEIIKAEWTVDKDPQNFRNILWVDKGTIRLLIDADPSTGDACYLYLEKYHHLDIPWAAATAKIVGEFVSPTRANRNGNRYECTTAGTTHATTEPTWPTTAGATVVDDGVTWTCRAELPNSLHDGAGDLEDVFINLCVARCLEDRAVNHANKINVGSAKAMEQYMALANRRLAKVLTDLRAMAKPRTKQFYPTS